jgi:hypothetical protein
MFPNVPADVAPGPWKHGARGEQGHASGADIGAPETSERRIDDRKEPCGRLGRGPMLPREILFVSNNQRGSGGRQLLGDGALDA